MAGKKQAADGFVPPPPPSPIADAESIRARIRKRFNTDAVPEAASLYTFDIISSGSLMLDMALGVGGYARGRITTFSGPQHAGKTFLSLVGIASIQRHIQFHESRPARIAIIDTEQAFSMSLAELAGCNTNERNFHVYRPGMADEALSLAMFCLGMENPDGKDREWKRIGDPYDAILFDSWAGTGTKHVGLAELAREGSDWLPTLNVNVNRAHAFFFFTNHIRQKPGVMFGNPDYEPGGNAFQHMRSVAMEVRKGDVDKMPAPSYKELGHIMKILIGKNKLAPTEETRVKLKFDRRIGFDRAFDALEYLKYRRIAITEGLGSIHRVTLGDVTIRENGEKNFLDAIRSDPAILEAFVSAARSVTSG